MSVNFLRNPIPIPALKSALRRGLTALPPLLAALLICLSLAAPAWAQIYLVNYTPKQSDADALARIKSVNDTKNMLTGDNWTIIPPDPAIVYNNSNGVTWDADPVAAQVTRLEITYKQLTGKLDATGMAALTYLDAGGNELTGLDVSQNTALADLRIGANQLTSLDVSNNTALTYLNAYNNKLASLDVSKNTALTDLRVHDNQLASLDVTKNTALTRLEANNNQLASLDVTKNAALNILNVGSNRLTSLDVTKNTKLTELNADHNQLTSLDVGKNTALNILNVGSNRLTGLDVTKNAALTQLYADNNQLTCLDVTKNTMLNILNAGSNRLTGLDVSKNTALTQLYAAYNRLTSLDVTKNTALSQLWADYNQLTSLDVSKNTKLTDLLVSNNQLTGLDVTKNAALTQLNASYNQLTSLDVSKNTKLTTLNASDNRLTSLDVRKNTNLTTLYVSGNPLSSLNLTGLSSLDALGIAETNLKLSGLNQTVLGQLNLLQVDPGQLKQENFSALTSLTDLGIYHRTATDVTLAANFSLPAGQITTLAVTAPQARSLDFSNYAPGLQSLYIYHGRLERVSGAAKLDSAKFKDLRIDNNRLPLSQIAPLTSAVNLNLPGAAINADAQSQVWFESLSARNKPFDLAAQLAPERALLGQNTVFRLLPESAVTTYTDGSVRVFENQALKEGVDYTLSADGKLTINKSGGYYLLMTNPALYKWWGNANRGEIMSLSGLLSYQARLYAEQAAVGGNPNAVRLGQALDWATANGKDAPLQAMLDKINNAATDAEALSYMNQAHGESVPAAVQYFAFNMKNLFRVVDGFAMTPGDDIIMGGGAGLAKDSAPGAGDGDYAAHPGQPWRVKLRLTGDWGSMDGHDGYYGYDGRSFGGALALERDVMESSSGRFTLGFAGAFSHSEVDFDNYDNASDSDDWAMAVYGRYQYNDWFAGARVGYGRSAASVERNLPTLGLTANSNPDLDYYSAALFTGYDFYFGDGSWRLTPVAGVNWLRTNAGSFDEVGAGDYNLSYDADNYDSLELIANVTLAKRIELSSGSALTPRINAGIGYETADNQVSMKSTFGDIPDFAHFGVDSPDVGRARLLAGAGIDWHVTDHVDLSLEYQGSFQEDYDDHMGLASFKVSW